MPPKRATPVSSRRQNSNYAQTLYAELTAPDNRTVVTAVAFFAASVAFLHSSWSEMLIPA